MWRHSAPVPDEDADLARLEGLCAAAPGTSWLRILDTDHFFAGALDALGSACHDAIAWAESSVAA